MIRKIPDDIVEVDMFIWIYMYVQYVFCKNIYLISTIYLDRWGILFYNVVAWLVAEISIQQILSTDYDMIMMWIIKNERGD